jgi:hypothetical protein
MTRVSFHLCELQYEATNASIFIVKISMYLKSRKWIIESDGFKHI